MGAGRVARRAPIVLRLRFGIRAAPCSRGPSCGRDERLPMSGATGGRFSQGQRLAGDAMMLGPGLARHAVLEEVDLWTPVVDDRDARLRRGGGIR